MNNFKWEIKHCEDGSGTWYQAKIKYIDWEYVVDRIWGDSTFGAYVFCGKDSDDITLKEGFKTVEAGKKYCEKHFEKFVKKIYKHYNYEN